MTEPAISQSGTSSPEPTDSWSRVFTLSCELTVEIPVTGFRLGTLLRMKPEAVIDSHWQLAADIPLRVNGELIAWGELEVVGSRLGIRLIDLA